MKLVGLLIILHFTNGNLSAVNRSMKKTKFSRNTLENWEMTLETINEPDVYPRFEKIQKFEVIYMCVCLCAQLYRVN